MTWGSTHLLALSVLGVAMERMGIAAFTRIAARWPDPGAFTHPLYEGQFREKRTPERIVTSVIVPLQKSFHPDFLPVADDLTIHFDKLLDLEPVLPPSTLVRHQSSQDGGAGVDLVSSPLRRTVERLHLEDGQPIAIEIRDVWWLSHYD